jgi:hypothetical protein
MDLYDTLGLHSSTYVCSYQSKQYSNRASISFTINEMIGDSKRLESFNYKSDLVKKVGIHITHASWEGGGLTATAIYYLNMDTPPSLSIIGSKLQYDGTAVFGDIVPITSSLASGATSIIFHCEDSCRHTYTKVSNTCMDDPITVNVASLSGGNVVGTGFPFFLINFKITEYY